METGTSSAQTTDSDISSNGLETKLRSLKISFSRRDDETFLSPDTESLVSSTSDEVLAAKPATSHSVHSKKLNEYLVSTNITPITQPCNLGWNGIKLVTAPSKDTLNEL